MKNPVLMLVVIIAVLVALAVGKDMIIKTAVEKGVQAVTGLPLSMKSFNLGILSTKVGIKGLMLYNPKGFPDKTMLNAPEIYVDYDLGAMIGGTVHLREARINIEEFTVVKNANGQLNLDSLKAVAAQKGTGKPVEKAKSPKIKIDSLQLRINKVVYKDYSRGGAPSVNEFTLNLNEKYSNITDPNALVSLIVFKALVNTTISSLANFDIGVLKGSIGDTLATAQKAMTAMAGTAAVAAKQAEQVLAGTATSTGDVAKGAGEAVSKATEGIKDVFGALPFGTKKQE